MNFIFLFQKRDAETNEWGKCDFIYGHSFLISLFMQVVQTVFTRSYYHRVWGSVGLS